VRAIVRCLNSKVTLKNFEAQSKLFLSKLRVSTFSSVVYFVRYVGDRFVKRFSFFETFSQLSDIRCQACCNQCTPHLLKRELLFVTIYNLVDSIWRQSDVLMCWCVCFVRHRSRLVRFPIFSPLALRFTVPLSWVWFRIIFWLRRTLRHPKFELLLLRNPNILAAWQTKQQVSELLRYHISQHFKKTKARSLFMGRRTVYPTPKLTFDL
jgi:hypothetical protein